MGGAALIGLIFIVAFQVCICSRCFKKRRNSRVLPESCTEIPYMTAQLPNAVPYDMAITGSVSNLNSSRLYSVSNNYILIFNRYVCVPYPR